MKVRSTYKADVYLFVLLTWVGLSFCETTFAQNSSRAYQAVTGRVTLNGRGLPGVNISVWLQPYLTPQDVFVAKTDAEGKYQLQLPPGNYYAAVSGHNLVEIDNGKAFERLRVPTPR